MYVPVCSACESPFQSTLPRRERRPRRSARSLPRNFNPRSREGSDACVPGLWISSSDFNPRSREGSDLVRSSTDSSSQHFNPRSREGSDGTDLVLYLACNISIHAPAKGATYPPFGGLKAEEHFNPRSREGSDDGADAGKSRLADFNPRSREGSDTGTDYVLCMACMISIHAPAKGATLRLLDQKSIRQKISIHAPAKGATKPRCYFFAGQGISIHAPAKGATAKITKTIPNDLRKINNYNNSFTQICAKHNCKFDIR